MDLQATLLELFAHAPAVGMKGSVQFVFAPDQYLWVDLGERTQAFVGENPRADTRIEVSAPDFLKIAAGRANIEQLFAAGDIRIKGNLGLATLLPQLINSALQGDAKQRLHMDHRYPAPGRISETLSANQPPLLAVERVARKALSVEEFRTRYVPAGMPLIIGNALEDWPLFNLSREESLDWFADLNGITRHGDYVSANAFSTQRNFCSRGMAEFIASLDSATPAAGTPAVYMGNNILPTKLLEAVRYPPYFERELFDAPRIWIGPKGTLTPLHRDGSDNLFAQVWGQKSFVLAAPHHREALGAWSTTPAGGLEGCTFDPESPDYQQHPQARDIPFLRLVLTAGDMLFLPEGWFHRVESLTTSLSVNFWIDSGRG